MAALSIREQLLRAVLAALKPAADTSGAKLYRSPVVALAREAAPALVVQPESEAITERVNDRVTRELTFRLTVLVRGAPSDRAADPAAELDLLGTAAHAALMHDMNFAGLALGLKELDCEWDFEDADALACALHTRYLITYRTLAIDPTSSG